MSVRNLTWVVASLLMLSFAAPDKARAVEGGHPVGQQAPFCQINFDPEASTIQSADAVRSCLERREITAIISDSGPTVIVSVCEKILPGTLSFDRLNAISKLLATVYGKREIGFASVQRPPAACAGKKDMMTVNFLSLASGRSNAKGTI